MSHAHVQNEEVRRRVIEAALTEFREKGIGTSGLKQIMTNASVKHGSFYYHFGSKEKLVHDALLHALEGALRNWAETVSKSDAEFVIALRNYLCTDCRDNPGTGCTVAALASEMGRLPLPTRQSIGVALDQIFSVLASQFQEKDGQTKRTEAIAMYSMIIGAMQLSRAVANPQLSEEILDSVLEVALGMVENDLYKTDNSKN